MLMRHVSLSHTNIGDNGGFQIFIRYAHFPWTVKGLACLIVGSYIENELLLVILTVKK